MALLALATAHKWSIYTIDFTRASLNGTLDHAIHMKPPPGSGAPEAKVCKVVKGLHGLRQFGRVWH